ncbi:MAG: hypothetical protein WBG86_08525, partial [Polyangiales bacterium]
FSLNSALPSVFVSGEGSFYPHTNLAVVDSSFNIVACDRGPGGGDYWGRLTMPMAAGDWYLVSDAAVGPKSSVHDNSGPYQIRIQTTADDPSWQTRDMPIAWPDVETELLARGTKLVQILSPGDGNNARAALDIDALAVATGSVDQFGQPYVESIAGNGVGLSTAVLDAVRALVGDTRRDVTIIAEDNAATAGVDESRFISLVTATQCPTVGINNCLGQTSDTCLDCLADSDLRFEFRVGNDFVSPNGTAQIFEFDLISIADGSIQLSRIPFRVMVPATGADYGTGFYQNEYDSAVVCETHERPDWGILTWAGSLPSDTAIEFEFSTADEAGDLEQIPTSVVLQNGAASEIDVGEAIKDDGKLNGLLLLRVRAKLLGSTDTFDTPTLDGWSLQFNCVPAV